MAKPTLHIVCSDQNVKQEIVNRSIVKRFNVTQWSGEQSWIDKQISEPSDVIMVELHDFNETDWRKLFDSAILAKKDVVFISDGEPNRLVDKAMRSGASYHLRTPLNKEFVDELLIEIYQELTSDNEAAEQVQSSDLDQFGLLVGSSAVMRRLYRIIRKAACSNANVLVMGESGVGKELVANTIHLMSAQCDKPFVALNCGALSPELIESELFGHVKGAFTGANKDRPGVFQQADQGTLFLDEITEMPLEHQVKLLRVLESGEYRPVGSNTLKQSSVRVISATNREPFECVKSGMLRDDLYFRLAHFPLRVPSLRERGQDIEGLAKHFLAYRNGREPVAKEISTEALCAINRYAWPGNVRELKHCIERAYILADDIIREQHLILDIGFESRRETSDLFPSGMPLDEIEKGVILKALKENNGNKSTTANSLGVSIKTLYNKLEKYQQNN